MGTVIRLTMFAVLAASGLTAAAAAESGAGDFTETSSLVTVYARGEGEFHTYRIPALAVTTSGVVLAFCEGRRNSAADHGDIDLLLKRSTDGGATWSTATLVHGEPGEVTIGNPAPLIDAATGRLWLAFCRNNRRVFVTSSDDQGATWAAPAEITASVRPKGPRGWFATGPGHGTQLADGRLIIPANTATMIDDGEGSGPVRTSAAHALFSDDHGATWKAGEFVGSNTNESTMAPRRDGTLMVNARTPRGTGMRAVALSADGGLSWTDKRLDPVLIEPACQGSLLAAEDQEGRSIFLFSNPASLRRERLTVRLSEDEGETWPHELVLNEGKSAYSDLYDLGGGVFGCLYERDSYDSITFTTFTLHALRAGSEEGRQ